MTRPETADETIALEVAAALDAIGVPIFAAPPCRHCKGAGCAKPAPGAAARPGPRCAGGYNLPNGWQNFTPDPRRLAVWRPGWALAGVCGHTFDVLDTDPRHGDGRGQLNGNAPHAYGIATTPSGGLHEWIAPLGVHKGGGILPGLDLQSGAPDGGRGFVFLPPTVRTSKATGEPAAYRWVIAPTRPAAGDETGAHVRDLLTSKRSAASGGPETVLGELGSPIPNGTHQETLFRYASSLRARGVPEAEARVLVTARAGDCVPPWGGPDSPWDAVRHVYKAYEAGEAPAPPLALVGGPAASALTLVPPAASSPPEPAAFSFLDWHEIAAAPELDDDWLVPGLLPARRGVALYSTTGVGKSLLLLELAVAVARGGVVLGATAARGVVLYVDHENDPRGDVWRRLQAMGVGPDDLDDLRYLSYPEMADLDSPAGGAQLLATAREVGAVLVVVDTASRTIRGEENSNDTWKEWDRHTGARLKSDGIAFVRLDHAGKDADRGQRGGSNKGTDVDLIWALAKTSDDEFTLTCEKDRTPVPDKVIAFRRVTSPTLHSLRISADDQTVRLRQQAAVWEALDEAGLAVEAGRRLAREVLRTAGVTASDRVLTAVLKARQAQSNAFATRPDWAPGAPEGALTLVASEGSK